MRNRKANWFTQSYTASLKQSQVRLEPLSPEPQSSAFSTRWASNNMLNSSPIFSYDLALPGENVQKCNWFTQGSRGVA